MAKGGLKGAKETAMKLMLAVKSGDFQLFENAGKRLYKNKTSEVLQTIVNVFDQKGNAAIHYAALYGEIDMCRFFIEKLMVDADLLATSGKTPLCYASYGGHLDIIEYLLRRSAHVNAKDEHGLTPLHHAVLGAKDEAIKLLVLKGACLEENSSFGTPLMFATLQGSTPCIKALLRCQANPKKLLYDDVSPLVIATIRPIWSTMNFEPIFALLEAGADVNETQILGLASYSQQLIDRLLRYGANPEIPDMFGRLPIIVAAMNEQIDVVRTLLPREGVDFKSLVHFTVYTVQGILNVASSDGYNLEWRKFYQQRVRKVMRKIDKALTTKDYLAALILSTHGYLACCDRVFRHKIYDCFVQLAAAVEPLASGMSGPFFGVGNINPDQNFLYKSP